MLLLVCRYVHEQQWGCVTLLFLSAGETEARGWVCGTAGAAPARRDALPSQFPVSSGPNWANWLLFSVGLAAKMPHQLSARYFCPSSRSCGQKKRSQDNPSAGLDVSPAAAQPRSLAEQKPSPELPLNPAAQREVFVRFRENLDSGAPFLPFPWLWASPWPCWELLQASEATESAGNRSRRQSPARGCAAGTGSAGDALGLAQVGKSRLP